MNSRPNSSKVSRRAEEKRILEISSSDSKSFFTPSSVPGAAPQDKHAPVRSKTRSNLESAPSAQSSAETAIPPPCPSSAARTSPSRERSAGMKSDWPMNWSSDAERSRFSYSGSVVSSIRRFASAAIAAFASAAYLATKSSSGMFCRSLLSY